MPRLFDLEGQQLDPVYIRLRDSEDSSDVDRREYLERLYSRTQNHLDAGFRTEFSRQTNQRFWELRLAATLLCLGFEIDAPGEGRPDFVTTLPDGRRLWIEATSPTYGEDSNPDRIPDVVPDAKFRRSPIENVLLRYTQAIDAKRRAFIRYRENEVVSEDDCCVVAVSAAGLWPHGAGAGYPHLLQAVLPIGNELFSVDVDTLEVTRREFSYRDQVSKQSGHLISTGIFLRPEYDIISGVIGDTSNPTALANQGFRRLMTANNPIARQRLPSAYFPAGTEYRITLEDDRGEVDICEHDREGDPFGQVDGD